MSAACSGPGDSASPPEAPPAGPPIVLSSEPWTFGVASGRVLCTRHYRLFTTLQPSLLTDRLPLFLESTLAEYRSRFGILPLPPTALDTYVVASRAQWSRLAARLLGPQAAAFQTIPRGGLTTGGRAILYDIGTQDTFALTAHEGWHQFTQSTFVRQLPSWLEEGLATTFEGFVWDQADPDRPAFLPWANLHRFDQLRACVAGDRLYPLLQVITGDPADFVTEGSESAIDYYAQVWALAMFLREGEGGRYAAGLNSMIADSAGRTPRLHTALDDTRAAFSAYITPDFDAFEAQFRRFVGEVVRIGARERITAGRSPLSPS